MAQVIWKGEAEICRDGEMPPAHTTWGKYKFPVGQPVEVTEEWLIAKARANKFFEVIDRALSVAPTSDMNESLAGIQATIERGMLKRRGGWPKGKPRKPATETVTDGISDS